MRQVERHIITDNRYEENGAIGIGRKVFGDSFIGKIIDSGFVFNPVRVNIL